MDSLLKPVCSGHSRNCTSLCFHSELNLANWPLVQSHTDVAVSPPFSQNLFKKATFSLNYHNFWECCEHIFLINS